MIRQDVLLLFNPLSISHIVASPRGTCTQGYHPRKWGCSFLKQHGCMLTCRGIPRDPHYLPSARLLTADSNDSQSGIAVSNHICTCDAPLHRQLH